MLFALAGPLGAACTGGHAPSSFVVAVSGGDVARGADVISAKDCGSCHTIPGIRGAGGVVGPPLLWMARRTFIAGRVPNKPENLVQWIRDPQQIDPLTAMPNLKLSDQQARDVAAYLYTLR
jgi:cytochrome c1